MAGVGAGSDAAQVLKEARDALGTEHPSLKGERERASFPVAAMTHYLDGGDAEVTATRRRMQALVTGDRVLGDELGRLFNSRTAAFEHAWACLRRLQELKLGVDAPPLTEAERDEVTYLVHATDEQPGVLNSHVFMPALLSQGSDEQLAELVPKVEAGEIIGCYAQTELGHGSNVAGIETTATYCPETEEIELHSPTLTSTKWWIGALGCTATHAVVMARLITGGKDVGVHGFLCQIRSRETHRPMPGVFVGDIGPKLGFSTVDNGFLRLNRVRVPRSALLSGTGAALAADGNYTRPRHAKAAYAGMTRVRIGMVRDAGTALARCCTIAVRYSCVRRQFGGRKKGAGSAGAAGGAGGAGGPMGEVQVLDYGTQQAKLLPLVAAAYAFRAVARFMVDTTEELQRAAKRGDADAPRDLHIVSAGLKSYCTNTTAAGMEVCRRCCGGHGFSRFAGVADWWSTYVHVCTAEGENTVLTQQVTRHLLRLHAGEAKASPLTAYLADGATAALGARCAAAAPRDLRSVDVQMAALEARAAALVARTAADVRGAVAAGARPDQAWNAALVSAEAASAAHSAVIVARAFARSVQQARVDNKSVAAALESLRALYCAHEMAQGAAELLECGHLRPEQSAWLHGELRALCAEVRPDAVALVDAFDFDDRTLGSALGRRDGQAYAALLLLAQREPLNQPGVLAAARERFLLPMLRGELQARSRL